MTCRDDRWGRGAKNGNGGEEEKRTKRTTRSTRERKLAKMAAIGWHRAAGVGTGKSVGPPRRSSLLLIPTGVCPSFLPSPSPRLLPHLPFSRCSFFSPPPVFETRALVSFVFACSRLAWPRFDLTVLTSVRCFMRPTTQKTGAKSSICTFIELRVSLCLVSSRLVSSSFHSRASANSSPRRSRSESACPPIRPRFFFCFGHEA